MGMQEGVEGMMRAHKEGMTGSSEAMELSIYRPSFDSNMFFPFSLSLSYASSHLTVPSSRFP